MNKISVLIVILLFGWSATYGADLPDDQSKEVYLPSGELAVVSEGNHEPRSVGSYTLRIYSAANPEFPYDNFIVGIIRPRDGIVERVAVHDVDKNGTDEAIVIMRSVGTGSYLSAEAIQYKDKSLTLLVAVEGLEKNDDPVAALENSYK